MVTRRQFLKRSAAASVAKPLSLETVVRDGKAKPGPDKAQCPNILIIIVDELRWDFVGAFGSPMGLTPNLDAMAQTGVRFEKAFTNQPLCAPSRACLITGQYATNHGVWRNGLGLSLRAITIAHSFRKAGYTASYIGKWHLAPYSDEDKTSWGPVAPEQRGGFADIWEASNVLEFTSLPYEGSLYDGEGKVIPFSGVYRVDFLTERAVHFLRQVRCEPFLLVLSYLEPHHQYYPSEKVDRFVAPTGYAERYVNPHDPRDLRSIPGDWQRQLPDYCGCIARLDEALGTILETLSAKGLREHTIVVFLTDHGCHFRTRNAEYKRSAHESSIRVPLVVQGPGFNRSLVVPELVSHIDLNPTLLEAAGLPIPDGVQGRSVMPLLKRQVNGWRNEVFIQISESMVARALRTERWKYCVVSPSSDGERDPSSDRYREYQLYDLFADPDELINLAGRREYVEVATQLRGRLKARIADAGEAEPEIKIARFYP